MAVTVPILIKHTTRPDNPPDLLRVGELCVELNEPTRMWVGVPLSIDLSGKKLLWSTAQGYVAKTGDVMTGQLAISMASPSLVLAKGSATNDTARIYGTNGGLMRWALELANGEAESGADAGSNFAIQRWSDDSTYLGPALIIDRKDGRIHGTNIGATPIAANEIPTKAYIDGKVSGVADDKVARAGDNMSGPLNLAWSDPYLIFSSDGDEHMSQILSVKNNVLRWQVQLGDNSPETGPTGMSAGSNFTFGRYDNLGRYIDAPLTLDRAEGRVIGNGVVPVLDNELVNKAYVDANAGGGQDFLPLTGGTLTGNLTVSPSSGWSAITVNSTAGNRSSFYWSDAGAVKWEFTKETTTNLLFLYDAANATSSLTFNPASQSIHVGYVTSSSSSTSGALTVAGGVGIGSALNVGGQITGLTGLDVSGGYSYIGNFNSGNGSIRPNTVNKALAVGWNFTAGNGEVDFWNCYPTVNVQSFTWNQMTSATTHTALADLRTNGDMNLKGALHAGSYVEAGAGTGASCAMGNGIGTGFYADGSNVAIRSYTGASKIYFQTQGGANYLGEWDTTKLKTAASLEVGSSIATGQAVGDGGECSIELGMYRAGNGVAYIDFHAQQGSDFDGRIFRAAGANGEFQVCNAGTGPLGLYSWGDINLKTQDVTRIGINHVNGQVTIAPALTGQISDKAAPPPLKVGGDFYPNTAYPSHIDLFAGQYGFGIIGGTLTHVSGGMHKWYGDYTGATPWEQMSLASGILTIHSTTASTSSTSGALQVRGGVGVGGDINAVGQIAAGVLGANSNLWCSGNIWCGGKIDVVGSVNAVSELMAQAGVVRFNAGGDAYLQWQSSGNWMYCSSNMRSAGGFQADNGTIYMRNSNQYLTFDWSNWYLNGGGSFVVTAQIKSTSGYINSISPAGSNSHFVVMDENSNARGYFYWDRTYDVIRLQHVSGNSVYLDAGGKFNTSLGCQGRAGTQGLNDNNYHNFHWGQANNMWIDNSNFGAVQTVCDYRTKKDVVLLESTWAQVKELKPISYTTKEFTPPSSIAMHVKMTEDAIKDGRPPPDRLEPLFKDDDEKQWGFLAHELQDTLLKSAAHGFKDSPGDIQTPNLLAIVAGLTKALQEAMTRIEALEARG